MMENAFVLKDVKVVFNGKPALDIDNFSFAGGKIHSLIGPSGAGKSTLLRVLNLLQRPNTGEILYFGVPLPDNGPAKLSTQRSMSLVFQKPAMFSGSVYYNTAIGLSLRNTNKSEEKARVMEALDMVGLKDLASRPASTLSGGEAQRIALARSLVVNPRVLLLDEPTANLDPGNVAIIEEVIRKIHHHTGATIIMVTHNLHQAKRLSHETVYLNRGKIVEAGPTPELFTRPRLGETSQFLSGEMVY